MPQLRESRKKPGPTTEAGDHCWGVREERGGPAIEASFSVCSQTAGHAYMSCRGGYEPQLLSWTPEVDAAPTTAAAAARGPVSKCRSLPTPSQETVQPATAKGLRSRANFPGRQHSTPQAVTTSCQPLPLQTLHHIPIVAAIFIPLPGLSK